MLSGIFWVLRSGAPWRDLPERYVPRTTCYNRPQTFLQWSSLPQCGCGFELMSLRPSLVARFDHSEGVQALQLDPGIIRCEVPLSDGVGFVSLVDPGVDLG